MANDRLDNLYQLYEKLSKAENIADHADDYLKAIEGSKGSIPEKKLTCQIVPKYFKHFSALQEQAIDALLDLCEDDDGSVRICAIKSLPLLCKFVKEHTTRIADILAQLLQLEDQALIAARSSLTMVLNQDPITTVKAIFNHIRTTNDQIDREKCVVNVFNFLIKNIEKPTAELEDIFIAECKYILQDANSNEFVAVMNYLKSSKFAKSATGQQELLNLIAIQAELDREFDPLEEGSHNVDRILTCIDYALPYFSAKNESTKFVKYVCDQVLPQLEIIGQMEEGEMKQLYVLRHLAQLSTYCGKLDNPSLYVVQIFHKIKAYMPLPPEDLDLNNLPNLDFSSVECLLYAFHRLARQCPDFLTHDPSELKEFQARLLYFSRILQGCCKALSYALNPKSQMSEKEVKKAKVAPKLLSNVNALIKDLFYKPPVYKCNVVLSFLDEEKAPTKETTDNSAAPQKRHAPITFESDNSTNVKQARSNKPGENLKLYSPPGGKFSNNFQTYDRGGRGSRGRGRGIRGRGTPRGWRN